MQVNRLHLIQFGHMAEIYFGDVLMHRFFFRKQGKMTPFLYRFALINEWGLPAVLVKSDDEFIILLEISASFFFPN